MIYARSGIGKILLLLSIVLILVLFPQKSSSSSKQQRDIQITIREVQIKGDTIQIKAKLSQYIQNEAKYSISTKDTKFIVDTVFSTCDMLDLNPYLVLAIMHVESEFNVRAKSRSGAQGLMQVKTNTKKDIKKRYHNSGVLSSKDPTIVENIKIGSTYVAEISKKYKNVDTVLTAYSRGPGNVKKNNKAYVAKVRNAYRQIASIK